MLKFLSNIFKPKEFYTIKKQYYPIFKSVVSYTTRPMRDYETNGVEHYFINNEKADRMLEELDIPAKTQIGEYRYFVTKDELEDRSKNLYIIDPEGIKYLLENFNGIRDFIILYVYANDETRYERAKQRPGFDEKIYKDRVDSESDQFNRFEEYMRDEFEDRYGVKTYTIPNNNGYGKPSLNKAINTAKGIIMNTYINNNIMYLIVGKTCSGKDTICNMLIEGR